MTHRVAVIGGGVGGSTVALRLAELGMSVVLFERNDTLVSGPPVCHLHAGGSLYRELSDEACLRLLKESIETAKSHPQSIMPRPTVIAVPKRDGGDPAALLPRLRKLRGCYSDLVRQDPANRVLGDPEQYFRCFERGEVQALARESLPTEPSTAEDWLVPFARYVDLEALEFPVLLVRELGVSVFRLAALFHLAAQDLAQLSVRTSTEVTEVTRDGEGWRLEANGPNGSTTERFTYLINACGYRSGQIDDIVGVQRPRLIEFKAAYLAHWPEVEGIWPELVFHGQRGTKHGMVQVTPYAESTFQLHGMSEGISLFEGGLAASHGQSSMPELPQALQSKLDHGWPSGEIERRTRRAIEHAAVFIPAFAEAQVAGPPLYGAQQIPGADVTLRTSSASFAATNYARTEIVKFSSALPAAEEIAVDLAEKGLLPANAPSTPLQLQSTPRLCQSEVISLAERLAVHRAYPAALAR